MTDTFPTTQAKHAYLASDVKNQLSQGQPPGGDADTNAAVATGLHIAPV